jgi:hypothetical protein
MPQKNKEDPLEKLIKKMTKETILNAEMDCQTVLNSKKQGLTDNEVDYIDESFGLQNLLRKD